MATSRRKRIVVLFGLAILLLALVVWFGARRLVDRAETADRPTLLVVTLFLLLLLGLAAVRLRAEQHDRQEADSHWQAQNAELQAREKKGREELGVAMDTLQKRFAVSQRVEEALRQSEHQVRRQLAEVQVLSGRLLEAQETERRRVARELHDEIGQVLTAVKINLQAIQRSTPSGEPLPRLHDSIEIVDRALQQVRNLSLELRPAMLDDLGLVAALRWYVSRQASRAGLEGQFTAEPPDLLVPPELATACFRIVQEAVTNAVRHAKAKRLSVGARWKGNELHLLVRDDGVGFDLADARRRAREGGSLGVLGMEERALLLAGRLEILSTPGQGTEVHVYFPLSPESSPREGERSAGS